MKIIAIILLATTSIFAQDAYEAPDAIQDIAELAERESGDYERLGDRLERDAEQAGRRNRPPGAMRQAASRSGRPRERERTMMVDEQVLRKAIKDGLPSVLDAVDYKEFSGDRGSFMVHIQRELEPVQIRNGRFVASEQDLDELVEIFVRMYKD